MKKTPEEYRRKRKRAAVSTITPSQVMIPTSAKDMVGNTNL